MKKRYYKEITSSAFDFVFDNSPIEFIDRTDCYDVESFEYYTVLKMQNVSGKPISSVNIQFNLFDGGILPYKKISRTYKVRGDIIGEREYVPIPQSYYKSMEVVLADVTYADGTVQVLNLSSQKKPKLILEQSVEVKTVSEIMDGSESVRDEYPALVIPEFGENAWICSCTHKNKNTQVKCSRCGREKETLMFVYSEQGIKKAENEINGTATFTQRRAKVDFIAKKEPRTVSEAMETVIEDELKKVDKRERYKDKMKIQALPRLALYFLGSFLIYLFICWVTGRL